MAVPNPCCCCTLQTGTKVVAIVNIIFSVLGVIGALLMLLGSVGIMAASTTAEKQEDKAGLAGVGIIVLIIAIISLIVCAVYLIISVVLLLGANQRNLGKCRIWLIFSIIFLILYILNTIGDIYSASSNTNGGSVLGAIGQLVLGILISVYEIWVVYAFIEELKEESGSAGYNAGRKNDA